MIDVIFKVDGKKVMAALPIDEAFVKVARGAGVPDEERESYVDDIIAGKALRRGNSGLAQVVNVIACGVSPLRTLNELATLLAETSASQWRAFSAYFSEVGDKDGSFEVTLERFLKVWPTIQYHIGVNSAEKVGRWFFETTIKTLDDLPDAITSNIAWAKVGEKLLKEHEERKAIGRGMVMGRHGLITWIE